MGCVSSTFLNQDDDFSHIGSTAFNHHIVSLTSTTYGLLSLDPPPSTPSPMTPPKPPQPFTTTQKPLPADSPPEVINSWELMAGLDPTTPENLNEGRSFRFSTPLTNPKTPKLFPSKLKENSNPNTRVRRPLQLSPDSEKRFDQFEKICPPNGENKVVIYTTTLRGVRKTFEDCNAVRSVIKALGFAFCEKDISMDRGFREELKEILGSKKKDEAVILPCVFIRGRYIGGAEEVLKIHEDGGLVELLQGLPRIEAGRVCDGCGDVRFLPCFRCNGSCKLVVDVKEVDDDDDLYKSMNNRSVVMRCTDCNENGLVLCPICS